jgi:SAM-dependent methyltransferase
MKLSSPGSAYDVIGLQYSGHRRTDPDIAKVIHAALGSAKTVLNVGAGTGSYEPEDRYVIAIEPSAVMRAQRSGVPAVIGKAESLPFDDNAFDASMAMLTIHHWPDPTAGLRELRRVTKGPVVVFTYDPDALSGFWFFDYTPEMLEIDKKRFPKIDSIIRALGGDCSVTHISVTRDCQDGFLEAFYARPEALLDPAVRQSQSIWSFLPAEVQERVVSNLAADLASGEWDRKYKNFRSRPSLQCALRLVVGNR